MIRQTVALLTIGLSATALLVLVISGAGATFAAAGVISDPAHPGLNGWSQGASVATAGTHREHEPRTVRLLTANETGEGLDITSIDQTLETGVVHEPDTWPRAVSYAGGTAVEYQSGPASIMLSDPPFSREGTVVLPVTLHGAAEKRGLPSAERVRTVDSQAQSTHVAVETSAPDRWRPYFDTVDTHVVATDLRFPGDAETSVVVALPAEHEVQVQIRESATNRGTEE